MELSFSGPWVMILVPFLAGTILFIIALRSLRRARDSFFWPYTNGRVLSSKITIREAESGKPGGTTIHVPVIRYNYLVKGREYECKRIQIMSDYSSPSEEAVRKLLAKYPPGSEVIVYYDPARPERAVLEKGISRDIYVMMAFSVILLLVVLFLFTGFIG